MLLMVFGITTDFRSVCPNSAPEIAVMLLGIVIDVIDVP